MRFTIATSNKRRDRSGDTKDVATWFRVTAWETVNAEFNLGPADVAGYDVNIEADTQLENATVTLRGGESFTFKLSLFSDNGSSDPIPLGALILDLEAKVRSALMTVRPTDADWSTYDERLESIDLTSEERSWVFDALGYLRNLLGDNFLKRAKRKNLSLFRDLRNSAPRAQLQWVSLADSLRLTESSTNFRSLINRLRHPNPATQFEEALTVLHTAVRLRRQAFEVTIDPDLREQDGPSSRRPKEPDLLLVEPATDDRVFVEVSRMHRSDSDREAEAVYHWIYDKVLAMMNSTWAIEEIAPGRVEHLNVAPCVNISRGLCIADLEDVAKSLDDLLTKVLLTNSPHEHVLPDKCEMVVFPPRARESVDEWLAAREMHDIVESPPIESNELIRAGIKIATEVKQLPPNVPGVIVLPAVETLMLYRYDIRSAIEHISREMCRYPQLLFVVISHETDESIKNYSEVLRSRDAWFTKRQREDFITEQTLVIRNPMFGLDISSDTEHRLLASFT